MWTEECWAVQEAEDIQSWLSFTGQLHGHSQETMGTLDLGGASTQITFLPQLEVSHTHVKVWLATHSAGISWCLISHSSSTRNRLSRVN